MLRPCPACRRHIDVVAARCVFCAAPVPIAIRAAAGAITRMSRAAIFAGAIAIAPSAAGCGEAAPRYETLPAASTTSGVIRGRVRTHDGDAAANRYITLWGEAFRGRPGSTGDALTTISGADGSFGFNDIPPGHYRMGITGKREQRTVLVRAGKAVVLDVELDKEKAIDPRHMAKPYGAPPARRRVV
jgi:hypothetical protein